LKENINDVTAHPYKKWYVDPVGLKHPELIEKQKSFLESSFKILAFDDLMKARKAQVSNSSGRATGLKIEDRARVMNRIDKTQRQLYD